MISPRNALFLALIVLPASIAQGQDWEDFAIRVCNSGTVTFEVASAEQKIAGTFQWSTHYTWQVKGWIDLAPKKCDTVWADREWEGSMFASKKFPNVDLIFAFTDSTGTWGAAALEVPDGTASTERFCVRAASFAYPMAEGKPSSQCDSGYSLMPASMHFHRPSLFFNGVTGKFEGSIVNVELGKKDRAIPVGMRPTGPDMRSHVSGGGKETDATPDLSDQLMSQLAKELAERRKAREQQEAEDARQAKAQAEVSVKQNICLSNNLTSEWRNPPADGKMEKLKQMLGKSFRERAQTPSYDQTKWFLVDSRNYPSWDTTRFPYSIVSAIPGGTCPSGTHHEFLALAP